MFKLNFILKIVTILLLFVFPQNISADEGMWLPMFIKRLNMADMQKRGLQLTAEEIYSVNKSSLKDAIINFNGYCTGEIISPNGEHKEFFKFSVSLTYSQVLKCKSQCARTRVQRTSYMLYIPVR